MGDSQQLRNLQWRLSLANKQLGKQGETIFHLRNENAALREALVVTPGDRTRLLNQLRDEQIENHRLQEKLAAKAEGDA